VDGNGLLDIYEPGILYLQQEDGSFVSSLPELGIEFQITLQGNLPVAAWGRAIFGSVMADVDDDGFLDMVVMDLADDSSHFYKGLYGLRLEEAGPQVGIVFRGEGLGTLFADFNGDGTLDLFFGEEKGHNQLFLGDGLGSFTEFTTQSGVDSSVQTYGVAAADYDNDGDLDIFIGACAQLDPSKSVNLLFRNNGDGTFEEVGQQAGIDNNRAAWAVSWLDYDHDGYLDVYVANMLVLDGRSGENLLYHNNGDGTFTDVAALAGVAGDSSSLSFGASVADFNNDGFDDIYVANGIAPPNVYINNGDGTFTDRYSTSGLSDVFQNISIAVADLNDDGWIDFFTGADRNPYSRIFMNDGGTNGFLKINLIQPAPNKMAIGPRLELWNEGVPQTRLITSGDGFTSQNMAHGAHFGIGTVDTADSLVVRWPDGSRDVWVDVVRDQTLWLEKGGSTNRPPSTFRAFDGIIGKTGSHPVWVAMWDESVDPEGQPIFYRVAFRAPSGEIVHVSDPLTELTYSADLPTNAQGLYTFAVTASDGVHIRRSTNIGDPYLEGTATEGSDIPRNLSLEALYPNPASGQIVIQLESKEFGELHWEILNPLGQRVLEGAGGMLLPGSSEHSIDTSRLASGLYALRIRAGESVITRSVVIVR